MTAVRTVVEVPVDGNGGQPEYLPAGDLLLEIASGEVLRMEHLPRRNDLRAAFAAEATHSRFDETSLSVLDLHGARVQLTEDVGGSVEAAARVQRFTAALLRRGGLAVRVESTGRVHTADEWLEVEATGMADGLLRSFVTFAGTPGCGWFSCGMHNLGLPDAELPGALDQATAGHVAQMFLGYLLFEQPALADGHSFAVAADAPTYRLTLEPSERFDPRDLRHNPFGVWRLSPQPAA